VWYNKIVEDQKRQRSNVACFIWCCAAAQHEGTVYTEGGVDPRLVSVGFVVAKVSFHQLSVPVHSSITNLM